MKQFTQVGRITSIHGIILPPKKKAVVKKYITMRFVLTGTIPSKKNMIWADSNIKGITGKLTACKTVQETVKCIDENFKAFIKNSGKYQSWMEAVKPVIREQLQTELARYGAYNIIMPLTNVSIKIYHYWKDDIERDLDNKQSTIYDLFKSCGIILNDNWQCLGQIHSECENYKDQILEAITTIDVTYRIME